MRSSSSGSIGSIGGKDVGERLADISWVRLADGSRCLSTQFGRGFEDVGEFGAGFGEDVAHVLVEPVQLVEGAAPEFVQFLRQIFARLVALRRDPRRRAVCWACRRHFVLVSWGRMVGRVLWRELIDLVVNSSCLLW